MTSQITYHGGGFVGLTGAVHFAKAGWRVIIYDPDQGVVEAINAGRPRAGDFLSYLDGDVATLVADGRLTATSQWDAAVWSSTHVVAVPTEKDGEPYDALVLTVLEKLLLDGPEPITLLVESTLTPGTIEQLLAHCREDLKRNDVKRHLWGIGRDVALACCPRRDWFPDRRKNLGNLHRVIGGVTPASTARALEVYATVTPRELLQPTDYRTAELVKALENALLHLPVMLLHQLAAALPDHDVAEAIRLASTHWRFASMGPFYLGLAGSGGRCVPLGSRYLIEAAARNRQVDALGWGWESTLPIAQAAIHADDAARAGIADVVSANRCMSAAVLGIAYRPEFKDAGRSPGLAVARYIAAGRCGDAIRVGVHDPLWSTAELAALTGLPVIEFPEDALQRYDAVLLATPHALYRDWPEREAFWRPGQLVLDGQGTWAPYRERLKDYGVDYRQVGTPGWMRGKG